MNYLEPQNQKNLYGLDKFMNEFVNLYLQDNLPSKILLSGPKGIGKSTLAYHFINFVLSQNEECSYNLEKFEIDSNNRTFKTILNKSNPNLILIDIDSDKKSIDINQIRKLILNLNKSSFNEKPRFVLIDNIDFLNKNSINALLKVLEEPNLNIFFLLINNNKKILPTLLSRCINFKINLSHNESQFITEKLLNTKLNHVISNDLLNYYSTPGITYNLVKFGEINNYNLVDYDLKSLLKKLIINNHYKKNNFIRNIIFEFIEFYFNKTNIPLRKNIFDKYSYFLKKISNTKIYHLDEESLFLEFNEEILNG
tara:strand:+ start:646 stop:1578 length:933 start_codon:yes stop_codon:yes gene_type:complete